MCVWPEGIRISPDARRGKKTFTCVVGKKEKQINKKKHTRHRPAAAPLLSAHFPEYKKKKETKEKRLAFSSRAGPADPQAPPIRRKRQSLGRSVDVHVGKLRSRTSLSLHF